MKITDLMNTMNYNLSREKTGESRLADIQKALTDIFFKKANLTEEEIKTFEANLYTNPQIFSTNVKYVGLDTVTHHFNQKLNNHLELNTSKQL